MSLVEPDDRSLWVIERSFSLLDNCFCRIDGRPSGPRIRAVPKAAVEEIAMDVDNLVCELHSQELFGPGTPRKRQVFETVIFSLELSQSLIVFPDLFVLGSGVCAGCACYLEFHHDRYNVKDVVLYVSQRIWCPELISVVILGSMCCEMGWIDAIFC